MGQNDPPAAGKTPGGGRGEKPKRSQVTVQTSGGAWLWKSIAKTFGSSQKKK